MRKFLAVWSCIFLVAAPALAQHWGKWGESHHRQISAVASAPSFIQYCQNGNLNTGSIEPTFTVTCGVAISANDIVAVCVGNAYSAAGTTSLVDNGSTPYTFQAGDIVGTYTTGYYYTRCYTHKYSTTNLPSTFTWTPISQSNSQFADVWEFSGGAGSDGWQVGSSTSSSCTPTTLTTTYANDQIIYVSLTAWYGTASSSGTPTLTLDYTSNDGGKSNPMGHAVGAAITGYAPAVTYTSGGTQSDCATFGVHP
jgi:hypothetical protein